MVREGIACQASAGLAEMEATPNRAPAVPAAPVATRWEMLEAVGPGPMAKMVLRVPADRSS